MRDKDVDVFLPAIKLVPDWFVTNKMIKKLYDALLADGDILFFGECYWNDTFFRNEMGTFSVDLNSIDLDDHNFYEDGSKVVIHLRFMAWCNKLKQCKASKRY